MGGPAYPESELVFRLLETNSHHEANSSVAALVKRDLDWVEVLRLISNHGLISQLYHSLAGHEEMIPQSTWETIRSRHRENTIRNLRYAQHLHDIYELFRDHDVRAIPYKGPVLTEYAYGDLGSRWFGDLDFLVAAEDVLRARELLQSQGYDQLNYVDVPAEALVEGTIFRWGEEFRFRNTTKDIPVELRFGFIGGTRPDAEIFDDLWDRRTSISVAGRPISVLSPTDRALLLLVHGTKHGWRRLSWVYDIALLLEQDIDWEEVLARAEQYGWRDAVLFGLSVTAELTGLNVPPSARGELKNHRRHVLGASALATFLRRNQTEELRRLEPITTVLFLNDTTSGSARELVDVVISPRKSDFQWVALPRELYPLYYFIRPIRLGRDALESLWKCWNQA